MKTQETFEFQEYTDHIDTSEAMLGYYRNQSGSGLEKYILMIEDWLSNTHQVTDSLIQNIEENTPLVIQADGGVGKKTLINKWHEYHQSTRQEKRQDLILMHFATTGGNNSNYFYALYRILVKLRETLNIGQKVELHQEKLRKYFSYWLQVCNDTIENQVINNPDIIYEKIILVFEGIDYFVDRETNREGNIAFWLPKYFPKNIKVIVTADRESETMKHFTRLGCHKVKIPVDSSIVKSMVKQHGQKNLCVTEPLRGKLITILDELLVKQQHISLYVKVYLSTLLPENKEELKESDGLLEALNKILEEIDLQKLKTLSTLDNLLDYILEFWGKRLFKNQEKFRDLMGLFVCTQKGLTKNEIMMISKCTNDELRLFSLVFGSFLMQYRQLWMIKNDSFRKCLYRKYRFKYQEIHERVAQALRKTPNSLRKLEEETYQLYNAKSYFKLKQIISDVENFLLLFNSYNKYDLCRYWQKLQEKSFDPVIEYNKAVESFEMHYHPSSEDLFRITVQISRFLKEFADFQTYYTPRFRHPEILGNLKQLDQIGLLGQFQNLELCQAADSQPQEKPVNGQVETQKTLEERVKQMAERLDKGKPLKKEILAPIQEQKLVKQRRKKQLPVQQSNVQVKSNQANFREFYYKQVQCFLRKVSLDKQDQSSAIAAIEQQQHSDSDSQNHREPQHPPNFEKQRVRQYEYSNLRKLFSQSVEQDFELNQQPPTNYYYKRWIWMQFPWVCMTMKCDYSAKIKRCFTSPTEYMTVSEQKQFTMQSLKIALEAKKKKQSVLEQKTYRKEDGLMTKGNFMSTVRPYEKYPLQENSITSNRYSSKSKKIDEIAYLTNSFLNLQKLTQEIEMINSGKKQNKPTLTKEQSSVFVTQHDKSYHTSMLQTKGPKRKPTTHEQLSSSKIKQGLLPRIKHSMNNEMQRELEALEKNNANMRKQMDSYLYMNKVLAKKLKQLKIIELNSLGQARNVRKAEETKKKIDSLEQKLSKVKHQYAYSLLQQQRLNILIKICKLNKTQNQQAIPPLTFQCSNFKKMIKWEREAIAQINRETEEIRKISNKYLLNCTEKMENQMQLNQQIKSTLRNRSHFESQVQKYDEMILEEVTHQRKKIDQEIRQVIGQKEHRQANQNGEKGKKAAESAETYEQIYRELSEHLPLDGDEYKFDPKYLWLIEQMNKKREFQAIIEERKLRLQQLQKRHREELNELQTFEKAANETTVDSQEASDFDNSNFNYEQKCYLLERDIHEKQRVYSKLLETKLSCLGMLTTWCSRLGFSQPKKLQLPQGFVQKIKRLLEEKSKTKESQTISEVTA